MAKPKEANPGMRYPLTPISPDILSKLLVNLIDNGFGVLYSNT